MFILTIALPTIAVLTLFGLATVIADILNTESIISDAKLDENDKFIASLKR